MGLGKGECGNAGLMRGHPEPWRREESPKNDEGRMTKEYRMTKNQKLCSTLVLTLGLRHCFDIRHSSFVIFYCFCISLISSLEPFSETLCDFAIWAQVWPDLWRATMALNFFFVARAREWAT